MYTLRRMGAAPSLCFAISLSLHAAVHAGPSDYIYTTTVEQGEREIDFKFGTAKDRDGERASAASLGFGYGATEWWFTEVYAKWSRETPESWRLDAVEWENKFQLSETGKYPVDAGLLVELERSQDHSEGWELRWGPLFQMEFTPAVQVNLNLLFERHYQSSEPSTMEMGYQWQAKYRLKPEFELGFQGLGAVGPWRDWLPTAQQEHKLGPALFGRLSSPAHKVIYYNAAWLIGTNANTARNTLRLQIEFEF